MKQSNQNRRAFTAVELLVVIAILVVFGTLLVPTFAHDNRNQAMAIRCLDNHSQLIKAWLMYATDSGDYVANNYTIPGIESSISKWKTSGVSDAWAPNIMTFGVQGVEPMSTTNSALAQAGVLVPYHQRKIEIYHCPADNFLSAIQKAAGWRYRLRSVSMNSNWGRTDPSEPKNGASPNSWGYGFPFRQWHRISEVRKPAERYVFVDEHANSINDGFFVVNWAGGGGEYPATSAGGFWGDVPGFYHNNATPFGFSDGHTEMKRWLSRAIPVRAGTYISGRADIRDQQWYVRHVADRL